MSLRTLYPEIAPFDVRELSVGEGHTLYIEQSGFPDGEPLVFLHGGPGAGAMRAHARFYDPRRYRIVLYDQRGVGKSYPSAATQEGLVGNTTWHLVDDLRKLADALGLGPMVLSGGSWGSTLALSFASRYPERVRALLLRGVMTFRKRELDWFFRDGASRLFPDAYAAFLRPLPEVHRCDPVRGYRTLLFGPEGPDRDRAVRAWQAWERRLSTLAPSRTLLADPDSRRVDVHALTMARLECLYSAEQAFLGSDDALLAAAPSLAARVPLHIVQGRYDLVCPVETALSLHRAWPGSMLHLTHAGHSMFEAENVDRIVRIQAELA